MPRSDSGTAGVLSVLVLVLMGLSGGVSCSESEEDKSAVASASQSLLEEDFELGSWPPTLDKSGACASVRATAGAVFCDDPPFDPNATYAAGARVVVGHTVYACSANPDPALCSQDSYEPATGANWQSAWSEVAACDWSHFGAQLTDTCWMQNAIQFSTLGYTNIRVRYDFKTENYDIGETLVLSWSLDGASWKTGAVHSASPVWSSVTTALPAEAAAQQTLYVRFATNADGDTGPEIADIDNIRVLGDAPAGCDYAQLCISANATCGVVQDAVCNQFSCGFCGTGMTCQDHQCMVDCSPVAQCGTRTCGQVQVPGCAAVTCGACSGDKTCVDGACVEPCSPAAVCAATGADCDTVNGGPCGQVNCGTCANGVCNNNKCECTATTCEALSAQCGHPQDGCGETLDCGLCPPLNICGPDFQCATDPCGNCGPLTPEEIARLEEYLSCTEECSYGKLALLDECLAECPPLEQRWDKNRDGVVNDVDRELAALEANDNGSGSLICYENGAVVPIKACESCEALHGAAFCNDKEGQGWTACGASDPCGDFDHECRFVPDANGKLCAPRACSGPPSQCTAFHLEEVSQDNDEVIVHVYYDYSPVPVTVLDLYLSYASDVLTLADSRPLAGLASRHKSLQASQVGTGRLRLVGLGAESTAPIATGPVAELVFMRTSTAQSDIAFSTSNSDQTWSVAPDQGAAQSLLANDALWGDSIRVEAGLPEGDRLLLYYSFDNPQKPLDFANVKNADDLCTLQTSGPGVCPTANATTPEEKVTRAKAVARFNALQHGVVQNQQGILGVSGSGAFFDGISDHVELPITLNEPLYADQQSFTASFWFYSEGDEERFHTGSLPAAEILWSHNHPLSERTVFAVALVPKSDDTFDLVWLEGGVGGAETMIKAGLPIRAWSHLAITYDATSNNAQFFLDGVLVQSEGTTAPISVTAPPIACPQLSPFHVGLEGSGIGTSTPQVIYFSSPENGLYGIERMDATGLARQTLVRESDSSAKDVHYSPIADRIVYSSTKSGSPEIWIADGDGSTPHQVTVGFGDTARGIAARRPRWSPDAEGVVFESNVFSVDDGDNIEIRGSRLFYLDYDRVANVFAIPIGSATATTLDYAQVVSSVESMGKVCLTSDKVNSNNAFWARSSDDNVDFTIWYTRTDEHRDEPRAMRLNLDATHAANSESSEWQAFESGARVRLLAAEVDNAGPDASPDPVLLLEREWVEYESVSEFTATYTTPSSGVVRAVVRYTPAAFEPTCWDRIRNGICDIDQGEDTNGDGDCNEADCPLPSIENLLLEYPSSGVTPDKDALTSAILDKTSPRQLDDKKELRLSEAVTSGGNYVRIEVRSEIDRAPIEPETVIATIDFLGDSSGSGFSLRSRTRNTQLYVQRTGDGSDPVAFNQAGLDEVLAAAFSPDAEQLVLSAIESARPVLVTTPDLTGTVSGTESMRKIASEPVAVEGLQWVRVDRALPCNWVGAFRDPSSKLYNFAFRGGMDELKVHSYVRNAGAIRSEAERGRERLAKDQPNGPTPQSIACSVSVQCPAYQVCEAGVCQTVSCDPGDPYACGGNGKCTLAASVDTPGGSTGEWVCAAECSGVGETANTSCFSQQCRNGPCRYCDEVTQSCIECRETVKTELGTATTQIEGCPDRNSFSCVNGSCVTECYSFEDGVSMYLCNPSVEYCKQGRCVTFDWSWTDLAPASFSSMSEMRLGGVFSTMAISQLYPIDIEAYGVEDYTHSPQILVQGRVSGEDGFLGAWFDIGTITVYNRTKLEAQNKPYSLVTRYPITDLRVKLITPRIDHLNGGSTGLGHLGRDVPWCSGDLSCDRRPAGSRATMGYSVGIPSYEVEFARRCREQGGAACDRQVTVEANMYLLAGQPAVIVTDIKVKGSAISNSLSSHKICSYEGGPDPLDGVRARHVWFGDPSEEQSNQRDAYYPSASAVPGDLLTVVPDSSQPPLALPWLLNCSFAVPNGDVAGLEFTGFVVPYPTLSKPLTMTSGSITETANGCTVDNGGSLKTQCYETVGDARMDFMTQDLQLYKTLELQDFTSFGYEASGI